MSEDSLSEFRTRAERFFDSTLPAVLDGVDGHRNRARAWRGALYEAGLAGIDYPIEYGGLGLGSEFKAAYTEISAGRVPTEEGTFGIGIGMGLPTLRDHGTHEVKDRFLEPGLRGDEIWCQLYSEPGAGSDLASLSTRAVLDGDEWVVTGQKVWTSGAQGADVAILLARTDPSAPKHRGISMLALPMNQDGVTVRPLRQMTGEAEFNEVFIDEARIPRDWVIGEVNDGWRMAVALLAHERVQTGVSSTLGDATSRSKAGRAPIRVSEIIKLAGTQRRLDDAEVRQELARLYSNEEIIGYLRRMGCHPSIGKLWRTIQGRAAANLAGRLQFRAGPAWDEGDIDPDWFAFQMLNCRGMSLGGGTDEIQKNTLGERVLGLPREPAIDKDVAFRDLRTGTRRPNNG
ncbi:MAG: dehydrogenase [Actinomycetia bacterium]|nr:dehydrogenase [Actinomycetes bacterium]MCP4958707.1 dehydrogenase [Actinomycetes bacterium]